MTTIKAAGLEFTLLNSIKELPKEVEIWRTNAIDGYLLFCSFREYQIESDKPKYAIKCTGADLIIEAAICGIKPTISAYERALKVKTSAHVKCKITKAMPHLKALYGVE